MGRLGPYAVIAEERSPEAPFTLGNGGTMKHLAFTWLRIIPLAVLFLPLAAASAWAENSLIESWNKVKDAAAEAVGETVDEAGRTLSKAAEATGEAWDKTKDAASDVWDKTKDAASEAWDKTAETTLDVVGKGAQATLDAVEKAKKARGKDESNPAPPPGPGQTE